MTLDRFFRSWTDFLITLVVLTSFSWLAFIVVKWAVLNSVWNAASHDECQTIMATLGEAGACWAVLNGRLEFFLFGFYPEETRWRPMLGLSVLPFLLIAAAIKPSPRLLALGCFAYATFLYVMVRAVPGTEMPSSWFLGGYLLVVVLASEAAAIALIIGVALALARLYGIGLWRVIASFTIWFLRGIPLSVLLFFGMIVVAYAFPPGSNIDTVSRIVIVLALHTGGLIAIAVIDRLRASPPELGEAARALGLSENAAFRRVLLPQALTEASPNILHAIAGLVRNTSLVSIISLFDPVALTKMIAAEGNWQSANLELVLAQILPFLAVGLVLSLIAKRLQRQISKRTGRLVPTMHIAD